MRPKNLNLNKRIAALEASLGARSSGGLNVIEQIKLPDWEKQILKRALQNGLVVISPEESDRLDASIDALSATDRARLDRAMGQPRIVVVSGADANL